MTAEIMVYAGLALYIVAMVAGYTFLTWAVRRFMDPNNEAAGLPLPGPIRLTIFLVAATALPMICTYLLMGILWLAI
jgi:hypothetical protein